MQSRNCKKVHQRDGSHGTADDGKGTDIVGMGGIENGSFLTADQDVNQKEGNQVTYDELAQKDFELSSCIREMETASEKLRAAVNNMEWVAEFSEFCKHKAEQYECEYKQMQAEIKKLKAQACEIEDQMREAV